MPDERSTHPSEINRLLGDGDPSPVSVINPDGRSPFLLIGDHAGNAIPTVLGTLGVSDHDRQRHIAWDIGTAVLGAELARVLDATFIHQRYSRLVIDCNRAPDRADAIPEASDGTLIASNAGLDAANRRQRIAEIHEPYQGAIAAEIAGRAAAGQETLLISLHSFTPRMNGINRPWQVGVLHAGGDESFAKSVLAQLRRSSGICVGDNEPYLMDDTDHTVPRHAFPRRLPYVELEISQAELTGDGAVDRWVDIVADVVERARTRRA